MAEKTILAPEDIFKLRELSSSLDALIRRSGLLDFQQVLIEKERTDIKSRFVSIEESRTSFMDALQKKYGMGEINIQTGEFTPSVEAPAMKTPEVIETE